MLHLTLNTKETKLHNKLIVYLVFNKILDFYKIWLTNKFFTNLFQT